VPVATWDDIVAMPNAIIHSAFIAAAFLFGGFAKGVSGLRIAGGGCLGLRVPLATRGSAHVPAQSSPHARRVCLRR
jgi:hypothetical protein